MKYLFCGLGSIGQRHLNNLRLLNERDIIAFRNIKSLLQNNQIQIPSYRSLEEAIKQKPDVAFITNPSIFHIPYALKLAKSSCHLFIEKPLSIDNAGLNELTKIAEDKKLIVAVGFMMRFHPAVIQIKKWLNDKLIGFSITVRMNCSEYLPLWHPKENYKNSYAGQQKLGGGPINTLSHEIDLVNYFFGKPESLFAMESRKSSLNISTEHAVEILFQYRDKLLVEVHLDYLQNPPKRTWEIVGDNGKIEFDYYSNELKLCVMDKKTLEYKITKIEYKNNFERNDMFKDELSDFISSIKNNRIPKVSLKDGIVNTKLLIAIHQSIKSSKKIIINY
ncbi:MAG: Gfo/Idh/MocA family oxidoreductase [Patescibacteria group bacterium]